MQLLSIAVSEDTDIIESQLREQLENMNLTNVSLKSHKDVEYGLDYLICDINEINDNLGELIKNIKYIFINVLADYIIDKYEEKIVVKIIDDNYEYFSSIEKDEILNTALVTLSDFDSSNFLNNLYNIKRKNIIIKKLIEYLENEREINIDGFITFRLQDYIRELEDAVEKSIDDYLMEREYREFIRLLKYFVDVQEPKFYTVHVIVSNDNRYSLLDENKSEITHQCIQDFMNEVNEGEINYDDLLVSSLITLAPERIVIHGYNRMDNKELLETIKSVFSGKVVLCSECSLCLEAGVAKK